MFFFSWISSANTSFAAPNDKIVKDAEANREQDQKKKELAEATIESQSLIGQAEAMIRDNNSVEGELSPLIESVKATATATDVTTIKSANDNLKNKLMELGSRIYQQEQANTTETQTNEDGSVDADIE